MSRSCRWSRPGGRDCVGGADGQAEPAIGAQTCPRAGPAREARTQAGEERRPGGGAPQRRRAAGRRRRKRRSGGRPVTRFETGQVEGAAELGYEQVLEALLSLIGRPVLVLFSGGEGPPFISGVLSGRLDRGELDQRLQGVLLRADDSEIETLFFHVGSRQNGFVIRPDEFERAFWRSDSQLVLHVGRCAISILVGGELGT